MASPFGDITNPLGSVGTGSYGEVNTGLPAFVTNVVTMIFVAAGLFVFFNLIFAGFNYMTAGSDKQKLQDALASINMSLLGLTIMVAASIITGIVSYILFRDPTAILNPNIIGPGSY